MSTLIETAHAGARVRSARRKLRMSQSALARAVNINPATVFRLETGETRASARETVQKIADVLQVSVGWLLGGSDDSPASETAVRPDTGAGEFVPLAVARMLATTTRLQPVSDDELRFLAQQARERVDNAVDLAVTLVERRQRGLR